MDVVEITENKEAICRPILEALSRWFGIREAKERYIREARDLPMFACVVEEAAVAFLVLKRHNAFTAEIHTMGVLPDWHRRGLGTRLLSHVERLASKEGIRFLTVKTLSPSRPDQHYEATRRFYRALGFVPLEELPDLWGPDSPCLMMIKPVADKSSSKPDVGSTA